MISMQLLCAESGEERGHNKALQRPFVLLKKEKKSNNVKFVLDEWLFPVRSALPHGLSNV